MRPQRRPAEPQTTRSLGVATSQPEVRPPRQSRAAATWRGPRAHLGTRVPQPDAEPILRLADGARPGRLTPSCVCWQCSWRGGTKPARSTFSLEPVWRSPLGAPRLQQGRTCTPGPRELGREADLGAAQWQVGRCQAFCSVVGRKAASGSVCRVPRLVSSVCTETRPSSLLGGGQKQEAAAVNP